MSNRLRAIKRGGLVGFAAMIAAAGFATSAFAHEGEFAKFNYCPSTTAGVVRCLYSLTTGGSIVLGNKTTPIVKPVTLQGGLSAENAEGFSTLFAATNGETLSKSPQPVPGGLLGIVPPESSPYLVKLLSKYFFENKLTGVEATLELARPANEVLVSEAHLAEAEGVALKLPVRVHLENPFLGSKCYVGSSSSPLIWNLTTGTTSPPPPNKPISGNTGELEFKEEGRILQINGNELVDNAWSAPAAEGCGGVISFLVDPVIDAEIGLPSPAGKNTAILKNTIDTASAVAVNKH